MALEKYLLFDAGGRTFSLAFSDIIQIIAAEEPSPLPDFPDYVLGTIAYDGSILPIIGLRKRFHYEDKPVSDRDCIIVAVSDGKRVGLLCDSVSGFTEKNEDEIQPPTDLSEEASVRFLKGELILDGHHVLVLDPIKTVKLGDEHIFSTDNNDSERKEETEQ